MSVSGVFSKGRAAGHPSATVIHKYIPRARVPWQPSQFNRKNLDETDLNRLWGMGRYREGVGNYNSGYSTEKTKVLEDNTISMIPKHELEKYMPDISLGSKALVTPVSLMSARNGHRVTHDMLHSYDPYIGRVQKPAVVDHENISVHDPNHVGLNAATLDSRGRIYRWLRRSPFFQEDQYFRRSTPGLTRAGAVPESVHEAPLMTKMVRLARQGHLKAACEEYRRVTTVPPVAVYRALTAACIPGAKLADAVAIFEDGNSRLFYVARDGEVLSNMMRCAVRAKHRVRVMWVYNVMRGRYYENVLARAEVEPLWRYRIAAMALEYLLDTNAGEEARAVYSYLAEEELLDCDMHVRIGHAMREALKEGKTIHLSEEVTGGLAVVRNVTAVAPQVASVLYTRYCDTLQQQNDSVHETRSRYWASRGPLANPASLKTPQENVEWLQTNFPDIDPLAVLRLARFKHLTKDLMAKDRAAYAERAAQWVELLSLRHQAREEAPLTYMRKSRPSFTGNPNVRVAWIPERRQRIAAGGNRHHHQLLAHEEGFTFHYSEDAGNVAPTRLVDETFAFAGETLQSHFLAQRPIHHEVSAGVSLQAVLEQQHQQQQQQLEGSANPLLAKPARFMHSSVMDQLRTSATTGAAGSNSSSSSAGPAVSLVSGGGRQAARAAGSNDADKDRSPSSPMTGEAPSF